MTTPDRSRRTNWSGNLTYAAGHSFEEALEFDSAMMTKTGATHDHQAAVAAFVAKEKPVFEGR